MTALLTNGTSTTLAKPITANNLHALWEQTSSTATDILKEAITQASSNLKEKGIVRIPLCEEGTDHYPNDPSNDLISRTIKNKSLLPESSYQRDIFIVKAGSLARKTLMPGSDIDFLVFPSNKESVPYAQALQKEIMFTLKKIIAERELPFKVDEIMANIGDFHIPPEEAREKLLQPTRKEYNPEFQSWWPRESIAGRILRDIEFIDGDRKAFDKLQEISRDRLFTPSTCTDSIGLEITRKLLEIPLMENLQTLNKRLSNGSTLQDFDPKDNGTRTIELFTWLIRARTGIEDRNPLDVIKAVDSLTKDEKERLEDAFKFLVILTAATRKAEPFVKSGEHAKLTQNNEGKITEQLGIETPLFRQALLKHLTATHKIISTHT